MKVPPCSPRMISKGMLGIQIGSVVGMPRNVNARTFISLSL